MDFFNYFIKTFIRFFTRKFFWVLLFVLVLFLCFLVFLPEHKSNAQTTLEFTSSIDDVTYNVPIEFDPKYYNILESSSSGAIMLVSTSDSGGLYYQIQSVATECTIYYWQNNYANRLTCDMYIFDKTNNKFNFVKRANSSSGSGFGLTNKTTTRLSCLLKNCTAFYMGGTANIENEKNSHLVVEQPIKFITSNSQLVSNNFAYFTINGGSQPYYTEISEGIGGNSEITLTYDYGGISQKIDISKYIVVQDNLWQIVIPRTELNSLAYLSNGNDFQYTLKYTPFFRK